MSQDTGMYTPVTKPPTSLVTMNPKYPSFITRGSTCMLVPWPLKTISGTEGSSISDYNVIVTDYEVLMH